MSFPSPDQIHIVEEHEARVTMRKILTPDSGIPSMWEVTVTVLGGEPKCAADMSLHYAISQAFMLTQIEPIGCEDEN